MQSLLITENVPLKTSAPLHFRNSVAYATSEVCCLPSYIHHHQQKQQLSPSFPYLSHRPSLPLVFAINHLAWREEEGEAHTQATPPSHSGGVRPGPRPFRDIEPDKRILLKFETVHMLLGQAISFYSSPSEADPSSRSGWALYSCLRRACILFESADLSLLPRFFVPSIPSCLFGSPPTIISPSPRPTGSPLVRHSNGQGEK